MDPTLIGLIGVVIGSLLSLGGNLLAQFLTGRLEDKRWLRERKARLEDQCQEDSRRGKEELVTLYRKILTGLSLIGSSRFNDLQMPDVDRQKIIQEQYELLAELALHHREAFQDQKSSFRRKFDAFTSNPLGWAEALFDDVRDLALGDTTLFPDAIDRKGSGATRRVQVNVSDDIRRTCFVAGVEVPKHNLVDYDLKDLTSTQRELLWQVYFPRYHSIPELVVLAMPRIDGNPRALFMEGHAWEADVNPLTTPIRDILASWENAYKAELQQLQLQLTEKA